MSYGLLCLAMAYLTHLMGESVLLVNTLNEITQRKMHLCNP